MTHSNNVQLLATILLGFQGRIARTLLRILAISISAACGYLVILEINSRVGEGPAAALTANPEVTICGIVVMLIVLSVLNLAWQKAMVWLFSYTYARLKEPVRA